MFDYPKYSYSIKKIKNKEANGLVELEISFAAFTDPFAMIKDIRTIEKILSNNDDRQKGIDLLCSILENKGFSNLHRLRILTIKLVFSNLVFVPLRKYPLTAVMNIIFKVRRGYKYD